MKGNINQVKNCIETILREYALQGGAFSYQIAYERVENNQQIPIAFETVKNYLIDNGYVMPKKRYAKATKIKTTDPSKNDKSLLVDCLLFDNGEKMFVENLFDVNNHLEDTTVFFCNKYKDTYVVYVEELDTCFVWRKTITVKEDGNRHWFEETYGDDGFAIVINDRDFSNIHNGSIALKTSLFSNYETIDNFDETIMKKFKLTTPIVYAGNGSFEALNTIKNYDHWLFKRENNRRGYEEPCAKLKELLDKPCDCNCYTKVSTSENKNEIRNTVCLNRLDDDFVLISLHSSYKQYCVEMLRVYVGKDSFYVCIKDDSMMWKEIDLSNKYLFDSKTTMLPFDATKVKGTLLEHFLPYLKICRDTALLPMILWSLYNKRVEQLCKCGMAPAIENKIKAYTTPKTFAEELKVDENKKDLHQWLGLNQYQMRRVIQSCLETSQETAMLEVIKELKLFFRKEWPIENVIRLNELDDETFDKYLKIVIESQKESTLPFNSSIITHVSVNGIKAALDQYLIEKEKGHLKDTIYWNRLIQFIPKLYKMCLIDSRARRFYEDYLSMLSSCPGVKWKLFPSSLEELGRLHDAATSLYELQEIVDLKTAFSKNIKKVKKYEYEDKDSGYMIKVPEKIEDLVDEGMELHHCVKSYVKHIADGKTNIVFIRKVAEPEKPFFTVEVDNRMLVQQIHGFGNCNIDTVPDLESFVVKWAKEKKLSLVSINKIR